MSERVIYLDNAATTAVDARVSAAMSECLGADGDFANPASTGHASGRRAALERHHQATALEAVPGGVCVRARGQGAAGHAAAAQPSPQ